MALEGRPSDREFRYRAEPHSRPLERPRHSHRRS
jgi:hypothetical protein